ncbi:ATP-binding protein [Nocardiopsis suaedae]|uniref:ATP-binding protein n=1 Tax=Nocardiopsis suaedae TaxID=3018444 RepID=A0ABT4TIE3_9ACTN|nr:ATP-binding protein [Nocardiopsis suaedae]MDA2804468.1 ATP-binding protein [Nocardiopsis suaedae]
MSSAGPADAHDEGGKQKQPSQATRLIQLADDLVDVVAGTDGRAYATARTGTARHIAFPLKGQRGLRARLARFYTEECGSVPSQSALTDVTAVLEGRAMDLEPRPVALRLATHQGRVVLDLGGADGRCVIAGPDGWQVTTDSPVLFRRTGLTSPIPAPGEPGRTEAGIGRLRSLLNVDEAGLRLVVGWLVSGLIPDMPHPIFAARGEQGTGKSTALAMLTNLIDPSPAPLRSLPKDQKSWATTASASWAVCLDNVSTIAPWLSDTLCKAVTGEGVVDRALYSDDDVTVLSFRRLLSMTSIDTGALASDLTERLLPVEFLPIKRDQRRTDASLQQAYQDATPDILAALLDLLCQVLEELPRTHLPELPRMADFARVLGALDRVTGWSTLDTYLAATEVTTSDLLDARPFTAAVAAMVEEAGEFTGTIGQLMEVVPPPEPRPKSWPVDATRAAGQLKRDAPVLRAVGITVEDAGRSRDRHRSKLYRIALQGEHPQNPQRPTPGPAPDRGGDQEGRDFSAHETTPAPPGPASAEPAPEPATTAENPQATGAGGSWGAAEADAAQLSNGDTPAPVEAGTCRTCHRTYRRYRRGTGYGDQCASCALGVPPPDNSPG